MPMKTIEGYSKEKYTNDSVLLAGGGAKALSDFIGTLSWDSTQKKITYTPIGGNATDLVTFPEMGLENLAVDVVAGAKCTRTALLTITTTGQDGDTYFSITTSEPIDPNQEYTLGFYVSGFPSGNDKYWDWPPGAQNNSSNWNVHVTGNGWYWGTGKYPSADGATSSLFMDDLGSNVRTSQITFSKFTLVKGRVNAYYQRSLDARFAAAGHEHNFITGIDFYNRTDLTGGVSGLPSSWSPSTILQTMGISSRCFVFNAFTQDSGLKNSIFWGGYGYYGMTEIRSGYGDNSHLQYRVAKSWNNNEWQAYKTLANYDDLTWSKIDGKPTSFTPASHDHSWSDITNPPSTYTPSAHEHAYITSPYKYTGQSTYNVEGQSITDAMTSDNLKRHYNGTVLVAFHNTDWGWSDTLYWSGYDKWGGTELATQYNAGSNVRVKIRKYYQSTSAWGAWTEFITSGNIGSQHVSLADSANSVTWSNVSDKPNFTYGLTNLCTGVSAGGRTTKVDNWTIQTTGANSDTYFYINVSEAMDPNEEYTLGFYVSGYPGSGYWDFPVGSQSNSNFVVRINKNGWVWGTGKFASATSSDTSYILDDSNRQFYNVITLKWFVLVKGNHFPYFSYPAITTDNIGSQSVANATTIAGYGISSISLVGHTHDYIRGTNFYSNTTLTGSGHSAMPVDWVPSVVLNKNGIASGGIPAVFAAFSEPAYHSSLFWTGYGSNGLVELRAVYGSKTSDLEYRVSGGYNDDTWGTFYTLISSGNIGSQSVNYATTAGSASSATSAGYATSATNATYATYVKDIGNSTAISLKYSSGGFTSNPSYLAAWNDYQITYVAPSYVNVGSADKVKTMYHSASSSVDLYPTLVDSNNSSATAETVYTYNNLKYNPYNATLTTTGLNTTYFYYGTAQVSMSHMMFYIGGVFKKYDAGSGYSDRGANTADYGVATVSLTRDGSGQYTVTITNKTAYTLYIWPVLNVYGDEWTNGGNTHEHAWAQLYVASSGSVYSGTSTSGSLVNRTNTMHSINAKATVTQNGTTVTNEYAIKFRIACGYVHTEGSWSTSDFTKQTDGGVGFELNIFGTFAW